MPQAALRRGDAVCVGVRVATGDGGAVDRAMRLAAFGIERDVQIVVLSETDRSGLERFGGTARLAGHCSSAHLYRAARQRAEIAERLERGGLENR